MASLSEIEGYKPQAELGAGNSVLPTKTSFDAINRAGEIWALQKVATAKNIFDQKIKDRDNMYDLFSKGQISTGNIDPNDRTKYVEPALKEVNDAYEKWMNAGVNDKQAYMDYQNAHTKYADIVTHTQSRYKSLNDYDQALQKAKTETEKKAIIDFRKKQTEKPFDQFLDPYVVAIDHKPNIGISDEINNIGWSGAATGNNEISTAEQKPLQSNTVNQDVARGTSSVVSQPNVSKSVTTKKDAKGNIIKSETVKSSPSKKTERSGDPVQNRTTGLWGYNLPSNTYNFEAVKQHLGTMWAEMKEGTDDINESVKAFENAGGDTQKEIIDGIKNAIVKYNSEVGEGGRKIDIDPDKIVIPTGQKDKFGNVKYDLSRDVSPYEYVALQNLAAQKSFKKDGAWLYDKDLTASMQKAQEENNKFLLKAMEGEQAKAKARLESSLTEGREIDKEKRMGNALLISAKGIDETATKHGETVTETGGKKKINLALTQTQLTAFSTPIKTTDVSKEQEGVKTETTTETQPKKVPDLVQKNSDGTYTVMHYEKDDRGKTKIDKDGNKKIDAELTHVISNESYLQGLASTIYDKKDMPTGFAAALSQMNEDKRTIKKSDIALKAEAAGYSVKEYVKLLKEKGIKIKD